MLVELLHSCGDIGGFVGEVDRQRGRLSVVLLSSAIVDVAGVLRHLEGFESSVDVRPLHVESHWLLSSGIDQVAGAFADDEHLDGQVALSEERLSDGELLVLETKSDRQQAELRIVLCERSATAKKSWLERKRILSTRSSLILGTMFEWKNSPDISIMQERSATFIDALRSSVLL